MSKRKAPKFNTVLEDFRRFIGESKEAEESQGKSESSVALGKSDKEVVQELPGAGKTKGGPTEPVSNKGVDATQKLPGTSEPSKEEPSRKECAPSSKVAEEDAPSDLVNRLLSNIKLAVEAIESEEQKEASANVEAKKELKGEQAKLDLNENDEIDAEDLKNLREGKPAKSASDESEASEEKAEEAAEEVQEPASEEAKTAESHCDTAMSAPEVKKEEESEEKEEESEEEEKEEEKEESKEASEDCQKPECGKCGSEKKETLEIDEDKLAEKIAAHYRNISVGYELGKFLFSSLGEKVAEEPVAQAQEQGGSEIDLILQALQELVASGEITEEQAQNVLMQLQAASEGGAAPEASAAPEEPKMASELFTEEEIKEIEAKINAKVAEWVAEGKTDAEITELVKEAAQSDAQLLIPATEQDKTAQEIEKKIVEAVEAKVAELKEAGATDEQIEQFLTEAAKEDAKLLAKAAQQEKIAAEILQKVEAKRQEKVANVSPEVQQILQALEALLQSGQITEEEAMMVLQELGLAEGAPAAETAPAAAPEAPVAEEAPAAEEAPEAKKEDK
jgi:hypothetical protein